MLRYKDQLKHKARQLRKNMTDSERVLWSRLRGKQISDVQFYRQKPIGEYIVDFFAPRTKLVIEVDGSQHLEEEQLTRTRRWVHLGISVVLGIVIMLFRTINDENVISAIFRVDGKNNCICSR